MNAKAPANGSPVSSVAYGNITVANARISATPAARPWDTPKKRANRYITTHKIEVRAPIVRTIVKYVASAQYRDSLRASSGSNRTRTTAHGISATIEVPGAFTE